MISADAGSENRQCPAGQLVLVYRPEHTHSAGPERLGQRRHQPARSGPPYGIPYHEGFVPLQFVLHAGTRCRMAGTNCPTAGTENRLLDNCRGPHHRSFGQETGPPSARLVCGGSRRTRLVTQRAHEQNPRALRRRPIKLCTPACSTGFRAGSADRQRSLQF